MAEYTYHRGSQNSREAVEFDITRRGQYITTCVADADLVGVTCTKRLNGWIVDLSAVIAENYCCTAFRSRRRGMQTVEVGFIGFEDDFELCEQIFKYAVDCVLSRCKTIRKEYRDIYTSKHLGKMCDAYGYGFAKGVSEAFERQTRENQEWGLVLVIPQEVKDKAAEMGEGSAFKEISTPEHMSEIQAMSEGYEDGQEFDPTRRLAEEALKNS